MTYEIDPNPTYTCIGSVRGRCGHRHESLGEALDCLEADQHDCRQLGGGAYSDRHIVHSDGSLLSDDEHRLLDDLRDPWEVIR